MSAEFKEENFEKEVDTEDRKTSRLEAIIKTGKQLAFGMWGVWATLVLYGSIVAEPLGFDGSTALEASNIIFPVSASITTSIIGILIGKEIK